MPIARSPTDHPMTSAPTADDDAGDTRGPGSRRPRRRGSGYRPIRCRMSARLIAVCSTSTRISSRPGDGVVDLLDRQDLGTTVGSKHDCAHLPEPSGPADGGRLGDWRPGLDPSIRSYPCGYRRAVGPNRALASAPARLRRTRARGSRPSRGSTRGCRRAPDANPGRGDAARRRSGYQRLTSSFTLDTSIER